MALAALLPTASASYLPISPHVPQPLLRSSKPAAKCSTQPHRQCQYRHSARGRLLTTQLLPTISNPPDKLTAHLDRSHDHYEPLSAGCWAAHLLAQAVASHVALHVLLPSADAARRALGLTMLLSTFGGGFVLGSHALIAKDPFGELLYAIGTRILRAASLVVGVGLVAPSHCAAACAASSPSAPPTASPLQARAASCSRPSSNSPVRILGTLYRAAYVAFFAVFPFLPSAKRRRPLRRHRLARAADSRAAARAVTRVAFSQCSFVLI